MWAITDNDEARPWCTSILQRGQVRSSVKVESLGKSFIDFRSKESSWNLSFGHKMTRLVKCRVS